MLNKRKKEKKEEGQALIEFVLALPVFLLIIAIILDFGWLFYNQIGMENAARNAARVACVEYTDVCIDPRVNAPYDQEVQTFDLSVLDQPQDEAGEDPLSDQERMILTEVKNSMPSTLSEVKVSIKYTYDENFNNREVLVFDARNRSKGDVIVQVSALHKAISPLVGWGSSDGTNSMERIVKCHSVYKVEKNPSN